MVTPLQYKVYQFIADHLKLHGFSPSLEEVARGIGISPKSISLISRSIHTLAQSGWLKFHKKGYRNILLAQEENSPKLPLRGETISIDIAKFFTRDAHFVFRAQGQLMLEEGVWEGDLVICRRIERAEEGALVIARIDQQGETLKRISYQIPERITLISANPTIKPKAYLPHRVHLSGIFVGLLRNVEIF